MLHIVVGGGVKWCTLGTHIFLEQRPLEGPIMYYLSIIFFSLLLGGFPFSIWFYDHVCVSMDTDIIYGVLFQRKLAQPRPLALTLLIKDLSIRKYISRKAEV